MKRISVFLLLVITSLSLYANNARYRIMFKSDPSTSIVIGWDQTEGNNPIVHYDLVDHGTNVLAYSFTKAVDRSVDLKGMNNNFARLTGLQPNTAYYFVINDNQGVSSRFWFKTAPDNSNQQLSFIAGGDSRNNSSIRRKANKLVSKLRPHAVMFGGDMTGGDTDSEWIEWMDDWQLTTGADGRMIPIVPARGNHESSNNSIYDLFDVPSEDVYYALTFGGDLIRSYTLNTDISIAGNQTTWLNNDLTSHPDVIWKMAQYHKPMRPHVSSKSEGNAQYSNWANSFKENNVKLVVECDAHTVKTTWPVVPSTDAGNDEGFVRDDLNGTVYAGEGCWGAPLRSNNDDKEWTRASGSFNQFKWIFVNSSRIEVRTIKVDNADDVRQVNDNAIFTPPANLDIWNPVNGNGEVVTILGRNSNRSPILSITSPSNGAYYPSTQTINVAANVSDSDGSISKIQFFIDDVFAYTDYSFPYSANLNIEEGSHEIKVTAFDNNNATTSKTISVSAGFISQRIDQSVSSAEDGAEEHLSTGLVVNSSSDLELSSDGSINQMIGIRFANLNIPSGAIVNKAYIQFTTDEVDTKTTNLIIKGHDTDNSGKIATTSYNISNRSTTSANVSWSPLAWTLVDESGVNQRTPELKSIMNEVVSKSGWSFGNAITFIVTGSGERTAKSFSGSPSQAPLLHVEYTIGDNDLTTSILERRVNSSSDDVEENNSAGSIYVGSSDLELSTDGTSNQTIGMRFTDLNIPKGTIISKAYVQFTTDEVDSKTTSLIIEGHDVDNSNVFATTAHDISSRTTTTANVSWSPLAWSFIGESGANQRTPDLSSIVSEIINRSGWSVGNAMTLIVTGDGERTAESFDGSSLGAPLLHIECLIPVGVTVIPVIIEKRIGSSDNDAEENNLTGVISIASGDLEFSNDGTTNQSIGIRFKDINIPHGASISKAYLQFTTDEVDAKTTDLIIEGHDSDNSNEITASTFNISSRFRTASKAVWKPSAWNTVNESDINQRTPELKSIVNEIINRSGWSSGNSMTFIMTGDGERTAKSYDGSPTQAPLLHIEYTINDDNLNPNISITSPSNNTYYSSQQTVNVTTNTSDADGYISKVEFFIDGTLMSTDYSFPFSANLTIKEGNHEIKVVASDNVNAETSETISVSSGFVTQTINQRVSSNEDDAEENISTGAIYNSSSDLELSSDGSINQVIGIRFANLNIPSGAIINKAYIQFTTDEISAETANLNIEGHDIDNSSAITTSAYDISNRQTTSANASWNPLAWSSEGESDLNQRTPDLQLIMNEVVSRSGWSFGNAITFIITGSGVRTAESYNGSQSQAPLLHVEYTLGENVIHSTIERRVSSSDDDAEENTSTGSIYIQSSDLELSTDGSNNQTIGVRFRDLNIPEGAIINKAYIQFTTDEISTQTTNLTIEGHDADNSSEITTIAYNISSRSRTFASVPWNPLRWSSVGESDTIQRTPELELILNEIVSRSGWSSGNAITLIITGTGRRTAESYDGSSEKAPFLHIEYEIPSSEVQRKSLFDPESESDLESELYSIYPNPANDWITVRNDGEGVFDLSIFSLQGIKLKSDVVNSTESKVISVEELPVGVYFIQIKSGFEIITKRFKKE